MISTFSLQQALAWVGGQPSGPWQGDLKFSGVSTDTRQLGKGDLFVAIRGEHFDGHRFIERARQSGAVAAVVDSPDSAVDLPQIVVPDTVNALAAIAGGHRDHSAARFVAVTGSSGKTTVREMVAAILAQMGKTLATEGNLNNHIGVPLTLFRLAPEHRYAAIELGASGLGEIAHTVAIVRPDVAILTNAGEAHLEGFGSYENIVQAKGEIIDGLSDNGVAVLNLDDPAFDQWRKRAGQRRVRSVSGQGRRDADFRPTDVQIDGPELQFTAQGPNGWQCDIRLSLQGEHNIANALMAIAATQAVGASDDAIQRGLSGLQPFKGRLQTLKLAPGLTVIDDSYNANPASMKAAIRVLASHPGSRSAILGAMAELGQDAQAMHRDVAAFARAQGIDRLLVVGSGCEGYVEGFGAAAEVCSSHDDAVERLFSRSAESQTVLVKGSRSSAMDLVVEGIKQKVDNACCSG
ncbi:UDP-N-acetylmuramoyl-tripeptide--D-alanyl-D-alanine ligase [Marinobacter confluentis]|uniref:UDP-N-acetylmuramoyl-tripeptide--D-alanyl-D-alanine ligase n=1 Tax=Marinobacter confluentis TaxID=1697557 RepID=A0A4Z1C6H1_9GAMM|nr:UDP-N-acetylmuramoyl-tripeptide--D-alanyl-D-alanine ligase [Marinobacter confluentis]TGN38145.1 UDP-N-acetylmuramoyl-tripeptide--D-alanyl-D-alanine ligase [Marinobacter confluentis]